MNIQKRYIDEATEMIDSWYEAIDQYDNMVNELAAALARIANEAAWDRVGIVTGKQIGRAHV